MKCMTFVVAMREYFGYRQGTGPAEFLQELKALTEKDKNDFKAMFSAVGIEIVAKA